MEESNIVFYAIKHFYDYSIVICNQYSCSTGDDEFSMYNLTGLSLVS